MSFLPCPSKFPPDVSDESESDDSDPNDMVYRRPMPRMDTYIHAAFRSSQTTRAHLFLNLEFVVLDYEKDEVVDGPHLICNYHQFKSLRNTRFEYSGITGAFPSVIPGEAFIFSSDYCAVINYLDHSKKEGPIYINEMFPFLKQTMLETGVDAAFEAKKDEPEAYIFRGKWYALINYGPQGKVIEYGLITEGFPSLRDTIFESRIDAAFASHNDNEAYIFKEDSYALIQFPTASSDAHIISGEKKILDRWPSLRGILPRKNVDAECVYEDEADSTENESYSDVGNELVCVVEEESGSSDEEESGSDADYEEDSGSDVEPDRKN